MKQFKQTNPPTHVNADEYWWCQDESSGNEIYPVLISAVKMNDGRYLVWYDVAGSDEGYDIDKAVWYGKVEIPAIISQ